MQTLGNTLTAENLKHRLDLAYHYELNNLKAVCFRFGKQPKEEAKFNVGELSPLQQVVGVVAFTLLLLCFALFPYIL